LPGLPSLLAGLIGDFDRYLAREKIDPLRDGASYNLAATWLDDAELAELARELNIVLQPRLANPPKPGHTTDPRDRAAARDARARRRRLTR
jgi:hypothetical protein